MNKNIIKTSIVALATIALLSNANTKVFGSTTCKMVDEANIKYVNASLVDINAEAYNAMMRGISGDIYYPKPMEERKTYDDKSLLFGFTKGMMISGIQNELKAIDTSRSAKGVLQGLAKNKLTNDNLEIINQYNNGTTLFPTSGQTGWDKPYNEILSNWKFPFLKDKNGYYSFNSEQYHVTRDYATKTFKLHEGARNGFFPFNNCQDDTFNDDVKDTYFTAKFEIPFIMTDDGKVKNTETGNMDDMVFNFSGDDDVWVYVDDSLVLDLGGTHIKQSGNINFAKNQVWYETIANSSTDTDSYNVYKTAFSSGKLAQGKHTLKIFYMERAGGISNLFTSFNLQSSGVEVIHEDINSKAILKTEYKSGYVGEIIPTTRGSFDTYIFSKGPENPNVKLTEDLQKIYYYYRKSSLLSTYYLDAVDNTEIAEKNHIFIFEGYKYDTEKKNISNYQYISDSKNTTGIMGHNPINVKYYYKYKAKITVNYIDKTTGKNILVEEKNGLDGDNVKLEEKKFDNYILVKKPETNDYVYTKKDQVVNYYYLHQSNVKVNYIDKTTEEKLDVIKAKVFEGSIYRTEEKQFENYKLIEKPENDTYIISKNDVEVNYFYEKLKFNLQINMNLEKTTINDNYFELKDKVDKVEMVARKADNNSVVKIYYKIKVKNNEERIGSGIITDTIPEGYFAIESDNSGWVIKNSEASLEVNDIKPNEEREYELALTKIDGAEIWKTVNNEVKITSKGIEETTLKDNEDKNDLVISPKTGTNKIIYGCLLACLIVFAVLTKFYKKR